MRKLKITHFVAERLHDRYDHAFAVLAMPSGAIALERSGRPIMRLDEATAAQIAMERTRRLRPRIVAAE